MTLSLLTLIFTISLVADSNSQAEFIGYPFDPRKNASIIDECLSQLPIVSEKSKFAVTFCTSNHFSPEARMILRQAFDEILNQLESGVMDECIQDRDFLNLYLRDAFVGRAIPEGAILPRFVFVSASSDFPKKALVFGYENLYFNPEFNHFHQQWGRHLSIAADKTRLENHDFGLRHQTSYIASGLVSAFLSNTGAKTTTDSKTSALADRLIACTHFRGKIPSEYEKGLKR